MTRDKHQQRAMPHDGSATYFNPPNQGTEPGNHRGGGARGREREPHQLQAHTHTRSFTVFSHPASGLGWVPTGFVTQKPKKLGISQLCQISVRIPASPESLISPGVTETPTVPIDGYTFTRRLVDKYVAAMQEGRQMGCRIETP